MSVRRCTGWLAGVLAGIAVASAPMRAQDSIVVRVGGDLAQRAGQQVEVPVTVDLSAAPGRSLGAYQMTLRWDPQVLQYSQLMTGTFATPSVNTDSIYATGRLLLGAIQPSGASGSVLAFTVRFSVTTDTVVSPVTLSVQSMTAAAGSITPFEDLLPLVRIVSGTFCGALGRWGDVDGDSASNSRDALMALSAVVGLPPAVGANPALADVDADGAVTSRDALIILSYAVGLPVPGFRVMLMAASPSCATGAAARVVISTDTLDLVGGQTGVVAVTALDGAGRAVPATGLSWRSLNGAVAVHDPYSSEVVAHGAGSTSLIAELGPGIADTLVVNVVARRANWYVDVKKARNVVTQTGSTRHPMEFIGDAIVAAMDGDTIRVAGGLYEEAIEEYRAVVVLGDSLDRPVIDPRGAPYYASYVPAFILYGSSGTQVLAHFVFRYGGASIEGGDVTVHHVRFDSTAYTALRVRSMPDYTNPAPGLGRLGNVLVDSVNVGRFGEDGVMVEEADSVEVRRSRLSGHLSTGCSGGSNTDYGNIVIREATRGWVHDNVVDGGPCQGIGVFSTTGRALIQRNAVRNIAVTGIVAQARFVATDHNAVRTFGRQPGASFYATRRGIWIPRGYCYPYCTGIVPDSVVSVADTVANLFGSDIVGFAVDTAAVTLIDQLRTDSIGVDTSATANAVDFGGLRLTITNGRMLRSGGHGVRAFGGVDVVSRGNRIIGADDGIIVGGTPDSVTIVGDSIAGMRLRAVNVAGARMLRVDSTVVDSAGGDAVSIQATRRALVARSTIRRGDIGLYAALVDTLDIISDSILQNVSSGMLLENAVDTVRIRSTTVSGSDFGVTMFGVLARIDSTVVSGHTSGGLLIDNLAGARVRHSRFSANGVGVWVTAGATNSVIRQSRIEGNLLRRGARNDNYANSTLDADSVWWGDATGPVCETAYGSCPPSAVADSILTFGITFANPLGAVPPAPAPPAYRPSTPAVASAPMAPRRRAAERQPRDAEPRPEARPAAPVPRRQMPGMSWQRGRAPRPSAPPRDR